MKKDYNPEEENKYLAYLVANNLYGWVMSQPQPTCGFKWMIKLQLKKWEKLPCVLEVDSEYPESQHDLHNDYPQAHQSLVVNKVSKLISNLYSKEKYVVHYRNLKQYLSLGMKLKQIHRGIF